jgi:2-oxoglutarate ferredoxin oxidoreductase subunit alpha
LRPTHRTTSATPNGRVTDAIRHARHLYTADGLEHTEAGIPSSGSKDHRLQLDKRERKLALYDYGPRWADIEGDSEFAVITFGSVSGTVREAVARAAAAGSPCRLIVLRLLAPIQTGPMDQALAGVKRVLVVEQNHGAQLFRYLRSMVDLPGRPSSFHRPGPLPLRPAELATTIIDWQRAAREERQPA